MLGQISCFGTSFWRKSSKIQQLSREFAFLFLREGFDTTLDQKSGTLSRKIANPNWATKKTRPYFPLKPGCLIGILISWFIIIPVYLGSISSPTYTLNNQFFFFIAQLGRLPIPLRGWNCCDHFCWLRCCARKQWSNEPRGTRHAGSFQWNLFKNTCTGCSIYLYIIYYILYGILQYHFISIEHEHHTLLHFEPTIKPRCSMYGLFTYVSQVKWPHSTGNGLVNIPYVIWSIWENNHPCCLASGLMAAMAWFFRGMAWQWRGIIRRVWATEKRGSKIITCLVGWVVSGWRKIILYILPTCSMGLE